MTARIVVPYNRAQKEHAEAVTEILRDEEPPLGLDQGEAICPSCSLAYFVSDRHAYGLCPECKEERLVRVPPDALF